MRENVVMSFSDFAAEAGFGEMTNEIQSMVAGGLHYHVVGNEVRLVHNKDSVTLTGGEGGAKYRVVTKARVRAPIAGQPLGNYGAWKTLDDSVIDIPAGIVRSWSLSDTGEVDKDIIITLLSKGAATPRPTEDVRAPTNEGGALYQYEVQTTDVNGLNKTFAMTANHDEAYRNLVSAAGLATVTEARLLENGRVIETRSGMASPGAPQKRTEIVDSSAVNPEETGTTTVSPKPEPAVQRTTVSQVQGIQPMQVVGFIGVVGVLALLYWVWK